LLESHSLLEQQVALSVLSVGQDLASASICELWSLEFLPDPFCSSQTLRNLRRGRCPGGWLRFASGRPAKKGPSKASLESLQTT
jgi:hypothetical protein